MSARNFPFGSASGGAENSLIQIPGNSKLIKRSDFVNSHLLASAYVENKIVFPVIPDGEFYLEKRLVVEFNCVSKYWDADMVSSYEEENDEDEDDKKVKKEKNKKKAKKKDKDDSDVEDSDEEDDLENYYPETFLETYEAPFGEFIGAVQKVPVTESEEYSELDDDEKEIANKRMRFYHRHLEMVASRDSIQAKIVSTAVSEQTEEERSKKDIEEDIPSAKSASTEELTEINKALAEDADKHTKRIKILEGFFSSISKIIEETNAYEVIDVLENQKVISPEQVKELNGSIDESLNRIKNILNPV
jgi:hypothetical protein